jgi:general nucleoside transport system permease protein
MMLGARKLLTPLGERLATPAVTLLIALAIGALLVGALGRNPLVIYSALIGGGLNSWPNIAVTLQMMTPLLFTGLSVAIAFRAGLVNIGAEGQMLMGAMAAGVTGVALPHLPSVLHVPLCIAAAFCGGLLWAAIPAFLRVYLSVNELVVCLMLNPVALLLTGYLSTYPLKAPGPTNKLPDVAPTAFLTNFSVYSQANTGLFIGLVLCIGFAVFNASTIRGFIWKMIGLNPRFAYYSGIDVPRNALWVMLVSGGIAGLAGAEQVLGVYRAFYDNFSPGYGFDGIAVAMLAQSNPLGVILASFLFGTLNGGSAVLQMTTGLSKYFVQVLEFVIVLVLSAQIGWHKLRLPFKRRAPKPALIPKEG